MKLTTSAWVSDLYEPELEIIFSKAWKVTHYKNDEMGGAGLCLFSKALLPNGEVVSVQTIISKKKLAKALLSVIKEEKKDAL